MERLIFFFLSISFFGCSHSIKDSYHCRPLKDKTYELCKEKKGKLYGVRHLKSGWELEPNLAEILDFRYSKLTYFKPAGAEYFSTVTLGTGKKAEPTSIVSIFSTSFSYTRDVATSHVAVKKDRSFTLLNPETGQTIRFYPSLDYSTVNEFGASIPSLIENLLPGFWVRQNEDGKKYFRFITEDGYMVKQKSVPAEKVRLFLNGGSILPFELIDAEKELYWPLIYTQGEFIEKPKDIKGLALIEWQHWQDGILGNANGTKIPTTENVIFVFEKNGKEVAYSKSLNLGRFKKSSEVIKFFKEFDQDGRMYSELSRTRTKRVSDLGHIYDSKSIMLRDDNGEYVDFGARWGNTFKSRDEMLAFLRRNDEELKQEQVQVVNKNAKEAAEQRVRDAELAESVRRERQKLIDEQAQAKAARRARIKAESDAAWSGVSDQLQNRARKADAKADCINKRTKKKQNFLDKKQNWYQDYDC